MDPRHKSVSLADQIFEKLEQDILSGKYSRGDVLTESKLSDALGVSRTPIREALRRLSMEHILEDSARGSVVIGITKEDVKDIFKIRLPLEGVVAAETASRITDEQLAELKEALELQEFYISRDNTDNIRLMDSRFHELIYTFCGSTVFYDTLIPLHRKIQKYRRASLADHTRAEVSLKEHKAIFDAIAAHDPRAAEAAAAEHVRNARARILNGGEE